MHLSARLSPHLTIHGTGPRRLAGSRALAERMIDLACLLAALAAAGALAGAVTIAASLSSVDGVSAANRSAGPAP